MFVVVFLYDNVLTCPNSQDKYGTSKINLKLSSIYFNISMRNVTGMLATSQLGLTTNGGEKLTTIKFATIF